ncbi:hypothetical protein ACIBFB_07665 [Nocardiopsis sp. NPDC050513]|uniref:hypothetical protein n=1 Tax=Nocardiopsis sp. NPDC050513 TaxID=3364338 RepID=UPI0037994C16
MSAEKLSVSLDSETLERARRAASRAGIPLSRWLDGAARREAALDEARIALEEHFAEHGEPTKEAQARVREAIQATGVGRPVPIEDARANQAALAYLDSLDEESEE